MGRRVSQDFRDQVSRSFRAFDVNDSVRKTRCLAKVFSIEEGMSRVQGFIDLFHGMTDARLSPPIHPSLITKKSDPRKSYVHRDASTEFKIRETPGVSIEEKSKKIWVHYWDPRKQTWGIKEKNFVRGLPKQTKFIKAQSCTLIPRNKKIRFYAEDQYRIGVFFNLDQCNLNDQKYFFLFDGYTWGRWWENKFYATEAEARCAVARGIPESLPIYLPELWNPGEFFGEKERFAHMCLATHISEILKIPVADLITPARRWCVTTRGIMEMKRRRSLEDIHLFVAAHGTVRARQLLHDHETRACEMFKSYGYEGLVAHINNFDLYIKRFTEVFGCYAWCELVVNAMRSTGRILLHNEVFVAPSKESLAGIFYLTEESSDKSEYVARTHRACSAALQMKRMFKEQLNVDLPLFRFDNKGTAHSDGCISYVPGI